MLILANDPLLKGAFQKDDFSNRIYVLRETPWKSGNDKRDFSDTDMAGLRVYLETRYRITGSGKIQDAFDTFIEQTAVHSVREYIKACTGTA